MVLDSISAKLVAAGQFMRGIDRSILNRLVDNCEDFVEADRARVLFFVLRAGQVSRLDLLPLIESER